MTCRYCGSFDHAKHCSCGRAITSEKADMCTDCSLATLPNSPTRTDPITLPQIPLAVPVEEPKVKTDDPFWHTFAPTTPIFWPSPKPTTKDADPFADDDYDCGDPPQDSAAVRFAKAEWLLKEGRISVDEFKILIDFPTIGALSTVKNWVLLDRDALKKRCSFDFRMIDYANKYIDHSMKRLREEYEKAYWGVDDE